MYCLLHPKRAPINIPTQHTHPLTVSASNDRAIFCPNCGASAPSGAVFCPNCGKQTY
ncbi:MAG: zinc-ribbon domain-containing protein [Nitrososphaerota archaeon]|nr:zinc-ribbon domain-containing protein [Nitrososphaerota archaeon]